MGAGVEPVVGPEDAEAGPGRAEDDRPVDGARPLVQGEERGVVLDGPELRDVERLLGHEEGDVGHHPEVGLEPPHLLPYLRPAKGLRLEHGDPALDRARLEGIGGAALTVRGGVDPHHVLPAVEQRFEHRAAERLLSVDDDSHVSVFLTLGIRAGSAGDPRLAPPRRPSSRLPPASLRRPPRAGPAPARTPPPPGARRSAPDRSRGARPIARPCARRAAASTRTPPASPRA